MESAKILGLGAGIAGRAGPEGPQRFLFLESPTRKKVLPHAFFGLLFGYTLYLIPFHSMRVFSAMQKH